MHIMLELVLFILGLAVGSFINALVYRWQNQKSIIKGRSQCPTCQHQINWFDLIPLFSYCLLRGHCRVCRKPISWHYPLIELLTGVVFVLPIVNLGALVQRFGVQGLVYGVPIAPLAIYLFFSSILIAIFAYDLRYMLIPDRLTLPAIIIVFIVQFGLSVTAGDVAKIWYFVGAGMLGLIFFLLQFLISRGTWIGGGDLRLGMLIGLMVGWPDIILALFLAYIIGTVIILPLVLVGRAKLKTAVPFGVFLVSATIVVLIWGTSIRTWYWGLLT